MLTRRVIPVVLMRGGVAVQSRGFRRYQPLGNPVTIVERLSDWASDELIYLDITRDGRYDLGRDDLGAANRDGVLAILDDIASRCFMPLTFGGGIRSVEDAAVRIDRGADKVSVRGGALEDGGIVDGLAREYGSQCVVGCVDAKRDEEVGGWVVHEDGRDVVGWARELEERGAGEILVQSVDCDGRGRGYDLELIGAVSGAVGVPGMALGGAGEWEHMVEAIGAGADAVAGANIFNHTEQSVVKAKRYLEGAGVHVRGVGVAERVGGGTECAA